MPMLPVAVSWLVILPLLADCVIDLMMALLTIVLLFVVVLVKLKRTARVLTAVYSQMVLVLVVYLKLVALLLEPVRPLIELPLLAGLGSTEFVLATALNPAATLLLALAPVAGREAHGAERDRSHPRSVLLLAAVPLHLRVLLLALHSVRRERRGKLLLAASDTYRQ